MENPKTLYLAVVNTAQDLTTESFVSGLSCIGAIEAYNAEWVANQATKSARGVHGESGDIFLGPCKRGFARKALERRTWTHRKPIDQARLLGGQFW